VTRSRWLIGVVVFFAGSTIWATQEPTTTRKLVCQGIPIWETEILALRTPPPSGWTIPNSCSALLASKSEEFSARDRSDWPRLSNEACSHRRGYVERVPGTCTAGGPPPICKVDHWTRDPNAMSRWNNQQRDVFLAREREMHALACTCFLNDLKQRTEGAAQATPSFTYGRGAAPFATLCSSDKDCPQPYTCPDGLCRPPNPLSLAVPSFAEAVKALGDVRNALTQMSKMSFHLRIVGGVLGSANDPMLEAYKRRLSELSLAVQVLQNQYSMLAAAVNQQRPYPVDAARKSITAQRQLVISGMERLSFDALAVTDGALGPHACPEVFRYQHDRVVRNAARIAALPTP